jgi:histidinol phosphatase-like enzyme
MIKRLFNKWNVNKKMSLFIGDKNTDYLCAKKLKIKYIHYKDI